MKELNVQPFKAQDLIKISIRPEQQKEFVNVDRLMQGETLEKADGYAWTIWDPPNIVFCAGLIRLWCGTGELWLVCDNRISHYVRELYQYAKHLLEHTMDLMSLVRAQTEIQSDWEVALKFAERMGFRREGLLKKFKDGQDYFMYARIR